MTYRLNKSKILPITRLARITKEGLKNSKVTQKHELYVLREVQIGSIFLEGEL